MDKIDSHAQMSHSDVHWICILKIRITIMVLQMYILKGLHLHVQQIANMCHKTIILLLLCLIHSTCDVIEAHYYICQDSWIDTLLSKSRSIINRKKVYIGKTKRTMKVRVAEHRQAVRKGDEKNGIAVHAHATNHSIDWEGARVHRTDKDSGREEYWKYSRFARKEPHTMNLDCGLHFSPAWYLICNSNTTPPPPTQFLCMFNNNYLFNHQ